MTVSTRILILYAHPAPHRSRIHRRMAEAAQSVSQVRVHDLYETYPDFDIDVQREQALVAEADMVVFQYPIQWYSVPALLKEWIDLVLEHGWAYGPGGLALQNKDAWLATTTGGSHASYQEDGDHRHPFPDYFLPLQQTTRFCGMRWRPPFILHGAHQVDDATAEAHIATYKERLAAYPCWPDEPVAR